MHENKRIKDKVVIVTGASSGIGEAAAREFARAGAKVVLAARRVDRLEAVVDDILTEGGTALVVPTDLTDPSQISRLVQTTLENYGRIDVLANIAGWGRYDWFDELTADNLRNQYEVNVLGLAELTRQVLPIMKRQRSGHILNMSSYASKVAVPPLTVYASTKYAVEGLSDSLRRELIPWGIHVTRIHPSGVKGTEFNRKAGGFGGIRFRAAPVGKVRREQVAQRLVRLVELPRRAVFMSRLYDVPAAINLFYPGLVDFVFKIWVRSKRRRELREAPYADAEPAQYRGLNPFVPLAMLGAATLWIWRAKSKGILRKTGC